MSTTNDNRDPLTGLWKSKYALLQLQEMVTTCSQVALIFIDIDRLHPFNYEFGHALGDEKIIEVAREIEELSGVNSLVCRFGGDEFIVVLPQYSLAEAREVAETIRSNRKPVVFQIDQREHISLTLSLGIAHFPTHVSTSENLLAAADLALLKATGEGKHGGRWPDGTPYTGRNRVMAIGDFLDDFPEQSAQFLK